jgi:Domain of unknown function (DUF4190)
METGPVETAAPPIDDTTIVHRPSRLASDEPIDEDYNSADAYRALSTAAVASLVLGLLSVLALLDWWLALIPFAGVVLGIVALRKIRSQPQEYTGRAAAIIGIFLATLFCLGGFGRLSYIRATEVPAGYERVDYSLLQPQPDDPPNSIPPEAKALDGKKIFIKGYVYPGLRKDGITQFLLVRDQGTCCFGGNPKITDRIQVALSDPKGFAFSGSLFKIAGTFRITEPSQAVDAKGIVFYHLDEAILP